MSDKQFYLRIQGRVTGPFTLPQLQSLQKRGQLRGFHELSEDRATWQPAAALTDLFPPPPPPDNRITAAAPTGQPEGNGPAAPAAPAAEWHYADEDGTQHGPVPRAELEALLRSGLISDGTPVWKEGMEEWVPLYLVNLSGPTSAPGAPGPATMRAWEEITGWRRVRTGLLLVLIALFLFVFAWTWVGLSVFVELVSEREGAKTISVFAGIVALLLCLAYLILEAVGYGFCATAPRGKSGKGLAVAVLVLAIVRLLLVLTIPLLAYTSGITSISQAQKGVAETTAAMAIVLVTLLYFVIVACTALFLLFLRAVCLRFHAQDQAQAVVYLAILYGILLLLTVGLPVFALILTAHAVALSTGPLWGLATFTIVLLGLRLGWLVWYSIVLFRIRGIILRHLPSVRGAV
jgi:hypothetical protein